MCTSNIGAVIDEQEQQEIISQKRSFDSNEGSSSSPSTSMNKNNQQHQQRKYVSLSEINHQSVEVVLSPTADIAIEGKPAVKSYNVVDLDDDVSTDNSASKQTEGKNDDYGDQAVPTDEGDIVSVPPNKEDLSLLWSRIAKQLEEEIAQGIVPLSAEVTEVAAVIESDERTQGSDNSKCSFGYEKPIIKGKSKPKSSKKSKAPPKTELEQEVLKSLYVSEDQPVFDKTPSKLGKTMLDGDHNNEFDNTTCTWSESADSAIPAVIYIRRDVPPAVPDDEALGQNYTPQQLRAILEYNSCVHGKTGGTTTPTPSKGYLMKGLRFLTLGAIGTKEVPVTPIVKTEKIHLDDDASEAFHQTLIDI